MDEESILVYEVEYQVNPLRLAVERRLRGKQDMLVCRHTYLADTAKMRVFIAK